MEGLQSILGREALGGGGGGEGANAWTEGMETRGD